MINKGVRYYLEPEVPEGYFLICVNYSNANIILTFNNANINNFSLHTLHLFECYEKHSGRHFIFGKRRIPSLQELCSYGFDDNIMRVGRLIDPPTLFTNTFYTPLVCKQVRFEFYLAKEDGKWFMTLDKQPELDTICFSDWLQRPSLGANLANKLRL
jgi:hypothetical protein